MNRKGFTLIELLAIILIIALVAIIVMPSVLTSVDKSKNASYEIMINNIISASKMYYEECEYGNLSDNSIYGSLACTISNNKISTTLGNLVATGFLTGKFVKNDPQNNNQPVVDDPNSNENIGYCSIIVEKSINNSGKVTYSVSDNEEDGICPSSYGSTS